MYGHTVIIRQIDPEGYGNYRTLLGEVKRYGERHFVVDCSVEMLKEFLSQAQQVGLMTEHYNYIILNLDSFTIDLSPYQYGGTNITGVSNMSYLS